MRPFIRIGLIALAISAWLLADCGTASGFGKGRGGGGSRGSGGGSGATRHAGGPKPSAQRHKPGGSHGHASAGSFREPRHPRHDVEHKPRQRADRIASGSAAPTGGTHPRSMQRANEQRKFDHRIGVADKLDRLAEKNGNEHLKETAERMRQKAQDHYDKRLAKIDSKLPPDGESDALPGELPDGSQPLPEFPSETAGPASATSSPATAELAQKLTARENALHRQLLNEERKLEQQTDLAERLRSMAEEQGDAALLETAERLEQQALDRFEKRMEAIRGFQERHGLALDD